MTLVEPDFGRVTSIPLPAEKKEMISVVERDGRREVRVNYSSISLIQECPRKALYSLKEGYRAQTESPALVFGKAIHKALEVFYAGRVEERRMGDFEPLVYGRRPENPNLLERAIISFLDESAPLSSLPETDKRSQANGVWILSKYFERFLDDPYVTYVDERGPFLERTFTLNVRDDAELKIDIFGTIDFAFQHVATGDIVIGDHKTSSALMFGDSNYFDRDKPNLQYTLYALGAKRIFGLNTEDFMVNVIEVKARPKTSRGSGPSFPRQLTKRTEEDFSEAIEVVNHYVESYLKCADSGVWPMGSVDVCQKYGGCQFRQVCASPKSIRETILMNKFTTEKSNA